MSTNPQEYLKKLAKKLVKSVKAGDRDACAEARTVFHRLREIPERELPTKFRLMHAQHVVAVRHGFDKWTSLKSASDETLREAISKVRKQEARPVEQQPEPSGRFSREGMQQSGRFGVLGTRRKGGRFSTALGSAAANEGRRFRTSMLEPLPSTMLGSVASTTLQALGSPMLGALKNTMLGTALENPARKGLESPMLGALENTMVGAVLENPALKALDNALFNSLLDNPLLGQRIGDLGAPVAHLGQPIDEMLKPIHDTLKPVQPLLETAEPLQRVPTWVTDAVEMAERMNPIPKFMRDELDLAERMNPIPKALRDEVEMLERMNPIPKALRDEMEMLERMNPIPRALRDEMEMLERLRAETSLPEDE